MKILNLLYDRAFKYVMDNDRMAKIVLSIILDSKIESLESKPTETVIEEKGSNSILRFDYKAVIQTETGENQTVLIELQKYKSKNPIHRFRNYLAKNYTHTEMIRNPETNKQEEKSLPIISVYILGYDLPEFSTRAIHVKNIPFDIISGKVIKNSQSDYVNLLTHSIIILIAADKKNVTEVGTRLEKFLNLFIQKLRGEDANYIIELETDVESTVKDAEMEEMINYLNRGTLDEKLIRQLDYEKEYAETVVSLEEDLKQTKKREAEAQKREAVERKQREEAQQKIVDLAKLLKSMNIPIEQIVEKTGLSANKIEKL